MKLNRILQGDIISEEKAVTYPFYFTLGMEHNLFVENTLLACEMDNFPKNAKNPRNTPLSYHRHPHPLSFAFFNC
jgi:hypothetical protein